MLFFLGLVIAFSCERGVNKDSGKGVRKGVFVFNLISAACISGLAGLEIASEGAAHERSLFARRSGAACRGVLLYQ